MLFQELLSTYADGNRKLRYMQMQMKNQ